MLKAYFRDKGEFVAPNHDGTNAAAVAAFTDRSARLALLEEQRLEACLMLPSWGVGVEPELRAHPDLLYPSVRAFNRWVEADWGFDDGRIVATAILSLADVDEAAAEIDRLAASGCRAVCITTGPIDGRSPADPHFDPVWARLQDHGIIAIHHIGATPFCELYARRGASGPTRPRTATPPSRCSSGWVSGRSPTRGRRCTSTTCSVASLACRSPPSSGARRGCPAHLDRLAKLSRAGKNKDSWRFGRPDLDPFETFARNQWIVPYYEDDIPGLVASLGDERLLAGSDYPHPEGLADPNEFAGRTRRTARGVPAAHPPRQRRHDARPRHLSLSQGASAEIGLPPPVRCLLHREVGRPSGEADAGPELLHRSHPGVGHEEIPERHEHADVAHHHADDDQSQPEPLAPRCRLERPPGAPQDADDRPRVDHE